MVRDMRDLRRALVGLAATQAGHFTAKQALGLGYSYPAQKHHADRGTWLRVERGIYRLPEWPIGPHDHLVRWTLWSRGKAVVSHHTALGVYDLGDVSPGRVHLTVPPNFRPRAIGVELHRGWLPEEDMETHEGFRVTTPLRSILDSAPLLDGDHLAGVIREAMDTGRCTVRQLRDRIRAADASTALALERALAEAQDPPA